MCCITSEQETHQKHRLKTEIHVPQHRGAAGSTQWCLSRYNLQNGLLSSSTCACIEVEATVVLDLLQPQCTGWIDVSQCFTWSPSWNFCFLSRPYWILASKGVNFSIMEYKYYCLKFKRLFPNCVLFYIIKKVSSQAEPMGWIIDTKGKLSYFLIVASNNRFWKRSCTWMRLTTS